MFATTPGYPAASAAPSISSADDWKGAIEALYATSHWLLSRTRFHDAADVFRAMAFFAPQDERAWLGLGRCHEDLGQPHVALQMYGVGQALARSVRCEVARARTLRLLGLDEAADEALERAQAMAEERDDDALRGLVRQEAVTP